MRNLWTKFALLTIVGSLLCGALLAGCGSSDDDSTPANNTANSSNDSSP